MSSGRWFIQLRLGGKSISVTESTQALCRHQAELIKAEWLTGRRYMPTGGDMTLSEAIDAYIKIRRNVLSPSTVRGYEIIKRNRFQSIIDLQINEISNWQAIVNREAKLCAPKTLRNAWRFVASVLREQGIIPPKIMLPALDSEERPWLDFEQVSTFMDAIKDRPCELPALLALSSLRRSEILALRWERVDLKRDLIKVAGSMVPNENNVLVERKATKNITSKRDVPIMIPRLHDLLELNKQHTGLVCTGSPDGIRKQIDKACADADLPKVGIHGLRHSFASLCYHIGMPELECMRIGGWANDATMHRIYTHIASADQTAHQAAFRQLFENQNANENAND